MPINHNRLEAIYSRMESQLEMLPNPETPGGYGGQAANMALLALEMMHADYCESGFSSMYIGYPYTVEEVGETIEILRPKLNEMARLHGEYVRLIREAHSLAEKARSEADKEKHRATIRHHLKSGVELPLNVARACISLLEFAMAIYQEPFASTNAPAGVVLSLLMQSLLDALAAHAENLSHISDTEEASALISDPMAIGLQDLRKQYQAMRGPVQARILAIALYPR